MAAPDPAGTVRHPDDSPGPGHDGLYLGLISGTSADGIDAALVRFGVDAGARGCGLVAGRTFAWDPDLRARLLAIGQGGALDSLDEYGSLDVRIGEAFAAAALALLDEAGVDATQVRAIGSHGQTLRHRPHGAAGDGRHPFSLQLGDGHVIAERTGITTVADFRRRDVAAGGHGAPLLPALHAALLADPGEDRAVLNLGGIANLTLLPSTAHAGDARIRGFDTGPANALLDAWCERHTGERFDAGGRFASAGSVDPALLSRLQSEPWFAQAPPKSSGREQFHLRWLEPRLRGEAPADVQATLLELTAATVADALLATQARTARLLACGGGVHNPVLMRRLAARLPGVALESTAAHGLDPDHVEAMGFAWLARQALAGLPGNLPSVTGARGPRILGCVHPVVR
jgi:anhydro-N-acetylmuramic acid kinase